MTWDGRTRNGREGPIVAGLILLGMGFLFLLMELDVLPGFGELWPVVLIIVGLAIIVGHFRRGGGRGQSRPAPPPDLPPPPGPP